MLIFSKFTKDGLYEEYAQRLAASCKRFDLIYHIEAITAGQTWNDAVNAKPHWILETLINRREGILWLDVDCELKRMPNKLLQTSADFAVYNFAADPDGEQGIAYDPMKLICGTGVVYFAYTAPAIELLIRWMSAIREHPDVRGSDPCLDIAYNLCRPPCQVLWLPKSYNRMDSLWPTVEPVIDHTYRQGRLKDAKPSAPETTGGNENGGHVEVELGCGAIRN